MQVPPTPRDKTTDRLNMSGRNLWRAQTKSEIDSHEYNKTTLLYLKFNNVTNIFSRNF